MNITTNMEDKMSDSSKKYEELYEQKLEEKMTSKGFGELESHDEEHVMDVVLKHFDLDLTDEWTSNASHYIYEESTADGYSVYVSTHDPNKISVNEHIFYSDNDLGEELKQAILDNDHSDVEIYLSMVHDNEYWVQDAINDLYTDLVDHYTDLCKNELTDEGFNEPDMLLMLANNE